MRRHEEQSASKTRFIGIPTPIYWDPYDFKQGKARRRRPGRYGGKPAVVAENRLEQRFEASAPDQVWVTDITYIKTHEGWMFLCVVIDLFSRRVVGWSAQSRMTTDLALQPLLMAVWRRKPTDRVTGAFRPRFAVHQPGVADVSTSAQSGTEHEPARKLP